MPTPTPYPDDENPETPDEGDSDCGLCCRPCGGCRRTRFRRLAKKLQYFDWSFDDTFPDFRSRKSTTNQLTDYPHTKCKAEYLDEYSADFGAVSPYGWSWMSDYEQVAYGQQTHVSGAGNTKSIFMALELLNLKAWVQFSRFKVPTSCQSYGDPHGCKYLISARLEFDYNIHRAAYGETVTGSPPSVPTTVEPEGTPNWFYSTVATGHVCLIRSLIFDSLPVDPATWIWHLNNTRFISSGCCADWPGAYCTASDASPSNGTEVAITGSYTLPICGGTGWTCLSSVYTPYTWTIGGGDWTIQYNAS